MFLWLFFPRQRFRMVRTIGSTRLTRSHSDGVQFIHVCSFWHAFRPSTPLVSLCTNRCSTSLEYFMCIHLWIAFRTFVWHFRILKKVHTIIYSILLISILLLLLFFWCCILGNANVAFNVHFSPKKKTAPTFPLSVIFHLRVNKVFLVFSKLLQFFHVPVFVLLSAHPKWMSNVNHSVVYNRSNFQAYYKRWKNIIILLELPFVDYCYYWTHITSCVVKMTWI